MPLTGYAHESSPSSTPNAPVLGVSLALLCATAGCVSVLFTLGVTAHIDRPVFLWPVTGALLALLLPFAPRKPKERFTLYLCGAAGVFTGGVILGMTYQFAATLATLTVIDLLITGALLVPEISCFNDLKQRRSMLRFLAATVAAPALTGLLGALPVSRVLKLPVLDVAFIAILANAIGIAFLLPLVLFLCRPKKQRVEDTNEMNVWTFFFIALFLSVATIVFWQNRGPYLFAIFPPMILLLGETGLEGAIFAAIALSGISWFATSHGHGPIWLIRSPLPYLRLEALQLFIWVSAMTALPVGAVVDERKRAERQAKKAESIHRLLLTHSAEVTVLSSIDGMERHVSPNIELLSGWTPAEYASQDRFLTVHPEDRERAKTLVADVRLGSVNRIRYRLLQKNGGWKWVDATVSTYGEDKVDGYVGTIRDISEVVESETSWDEERRRFDEEQRRLAEAEEATQLQLKMRDEFLSNVSHELRSPLASIYSFTTIIDDGFAGPPTLEQKEYLGVILKNVSHLQSMIEDLLTVTRSKEGKLEINVQPISITGSVRDIVRNLEINAKTKMINLTWTEQGFIPAVLADPVRLKQVLTILIDNALKFTPEGGSIEVSIREITGGFVLARITDTGCGIPRDKWKKIFDKLYQTTENHSADTRASARQGLGLGLHIAKNLIARQGGQIWVTSVPQAGSAFHFTLPVYEEVRSESLEDLPAA